MEVLDVRVVDVKSGTRLVAEVRYAGSAIPEEYWFEVPRTHSSDLCASGDPWLACLLPLAVTLGEPLKIPLSVDQPLLENAQRLMRIWRAWYPQLTLIPVDAEPASAPIGTRPGRVAAFFSGGVDSFFTLLRDRATAAPSERHEIDDLITVWGFDIPLSRPTAFERMVARHEQVAQAAGRQLVRIATNLRTTRWASAGWAYLAHGGALAGVALALGRRFRSVYIAGGGGYRGLHPWGSHSVTDPLFSTWNTNIVYDGVAFLRTEKVERIAGAQLVQRALRVCYELESDENCGVCNKCLRTMLTLDILGALGSARTFPRRTVDLKDVARTDLSYFADFREYQDIRALAVERGRQDVVRAIDRAVRRTRRLRPGRQALGLVRRSAGAARSLLARWPR